MRTRSPFPGVDPWLESDWSDVHHRLITTFADQIQEQLPEGLFAAIEVTVYIADDEAQRGMVIPDVSVLDPSRGWTGASSGGDSGATVATPYRIKVPIGPIEEGHVVIRSVKDESRLITVIEIFSPTNKTTRKGRREYILKREEYYQAKANLVEIDLLRKGVELVDVPFEEVPERLITPYKAVVRRAYPRDDTEAEYYPLPLREPLPRISVPVRRGDPDAILSLQDALDEAYKRGRYGTRIDYSKPARPQLAPEDAAWAAELISKSQ